MVVTHDPHVARRAERVLVLADGRIVRARPWRRAARRRGGEALRPRRSMTTPDLLRFAAGTAGAPPAHRPLAARRGDRHRRGGRAHRARRGRAALRDRRVRAASAPTCCRRLPAGRETTGGPARHRRRPARPHPRRRRGDRRSLRGRDYASPDGRSAPRRWRHGERRPPGAGDGRHRRVGPMRRLDGRARPLPAAGEPGAGAPIVVLGARRSPRAVPAATTRSARPCGSAAGAAG